MTLKPSLLTHSLTALALCAAPLLVQAQNCPTGINTDANYILGDIDGTGAAMHWATGLVWKRCLEGQSGSQCAGGAAQIKTWNAWANTNALLPQSFTNQANWGINSLSPTHDLLQSGDWRMAYMNELRTITENCGDNPKLNHVVFPTALSSVVWSGSPVAYGSNNAWVVHFGYGGAYYGDRSDNYPVRLVLTGQSFAALTSPTAQTVAANAQASFGPITLAPSTSSGQAWGGVRISGTGNPKFQINSAGDWLQEAIVKSTDTLTVRLTAPAAGSHTATLTLRSGQTTGSADVATLGDEATAMQETSADFTVSAQPPPPTLSTVFDDTTPVIGPIGNHSSTNDSTPTFAGTAQPGSTITLYANGLPIGTTTSDSSLGAWTYGAQRLSDGTYQFTFSATVGSSASLPSPPFTFTVDTTAPPAPVLTAIQFGGPSAPTTITGTAEASSVILLYDNGALLDTVTATVSGNWSFTTSTPLPTKPNQLTAYAVDAAGNTSLPSASHTMLANDALTLPDGGGSAQVTITSNTNGCTLGTPPAFGAANLSGAPTNATAPLGALAFAATGCPGATLTVRITYPPGHLANLTPYKFGPPSAGATPTWFEHGKISGDTVTYTVTDNGLGDNDPASGAIADPFAPMLLTAPPGSAQPIPTLSEWAMLLMAGLLGLLGSGTLRRRGVLQE